MMMMMSTQARHVIRHTVCRRLQSRSVDPLVTLFVTQPVAQRTGSSRYLSHCLPMQWRIQRGKSGHGPPIEVVNGVWHPLGGRKSNDSIVNLSKCKDRKS